MITLLSRLFIVDRHDYANPAVRRAYGVLAGAVGILLNIVLFPPPSCFITVDHQPMRRAYHFLKQRLVSPWCSVIIYSGSFYLVAYL